MISFQYNRFSELYYITLQNKLGAGKGTVREHITVETIISIPYFGLICKLLDEKTAALESAAENVLRTFIKKMIDFKTDNNDTFEKTRHKQSRCKYAG